ncbi:Hsp70 family protein [Ureibacillus acetophenoni]|uniref:Chaperone protein DnaK n=1 Tax=Ureibacillus acetophenoni TaxID=614649 RepID=A0A285U5X6_9BACL|nr:Hsp70 family protein [Ureibacillus acetophenoni]SOC37087.1 molecular chaperone DnaK [Ureibacillus acetophenoni]
MHQIKMKYIGIDLGTTNSTISIAYKSSNGNDIFSKTLGVTQVDETGVNMSSSHNILPSVVYYDEYETPFVGMYAKKMMSISPKQVLSKVKRFIGKEGKWTLTNGQSFTPQEVSGIVLSVLRREAENYFMGEEVDSAVITVPASFDLLQQNATKEAAQIAGFDLSKIRLIPEPRAAILDFINEEQKKAPDFRLIDVTTPKNIMVFDIGGGTCDVTIHNVSVKENHVIRIKDLSISQYTELGGIDFDNLIAQAITVKVLQMTGVTPKDFKELYSVEIKEEILEFAERAKKVISNSIRTKSVGMKFEESIGKFKEVQDRYVFTQLTGKLSLNQPVTITREEIDEAIRPLLFDASNSKKNIEQPIKNAFETSVIPISKDDIDCILLVGGMSYYPTIRERIFEMFDQRIIPVTPVDPLESISRGAAVYHLWKETDNQSDDDGDLIYPQNVFIKVKTGTPETLVKYGQQLPYKSPLIKNKFFVGGGKFGDEYTNDMILELFTAIDPESPKTKTLGKAYIQFKEPVRVGTPLTFEVNVDIERNVTVKAWLTEDESQMVKVTLGEPEISEKEQAKIKEQIEKMNQRLKQ